MHSHRITLLSCFDEPNLPLDSTLEHVIEMLRSHGLDSNRYKISSGHGSRQFKRPTGKLYSSDKILEEVYKDTFEEIGPGFMIRALHGQDEQSIVVSPPYPRSPFQTFGMSDAPNLGTSEFRDLMRGLSPLGNLAFAGLNEGSYLEWQRCDKLDYYVRKYGPNPGFELIHLEIAPARPAIVLLDISKNPGRISAMNGMPVWVSADMWLGPAFWKYAPCTKEEVLKEPWVEVEDTEHYLYLKAYPEPFTRPDGEQGRLQRRLWNVLFHRDCEWPPGSGGIA